MIMATRSMIGVQQKDGTVKAIYCHWDGYPDGVGMMLETFYGNPADANKLIDMGNMSVIGATIGEKVTFGSHTGGAQCVFFGRDGGESDQEATVYASFDEFEKSLDNWGVNYAYYMKDDYWVAYQIVYPTYDEGKTVKQLGRIHVKVQFEKVA